mgnify:CR=1 FL=1
MSIRTSPLHGIMRAFIKPLISLRRLITELKWKVKGDKTAVRQNRDHIYIKNNPQGGLKQVSRA